jgi:hypothetical protein
MAWGNMLGRGDGYATFIQETPIFALVLRDRHTACENAERPRVFQRLFMNQKTALALAHNSGILFGFRPETGPARLQI